MYSIDDLVGVMVSSLEDYDDGNECFYYVAEDTVRTEGGRLLTIEVDTGGNGVFQFQVEFRETTDPPYKQESR